MQQHGGTELGGDAAESEQQRQQVFVQNYDHDHHDNGHHDDDDDADDADDL